MSCGNNLIHYFRIGIAVNVTTIHILSGTAWRAERCPPRYDPVRKPLVRTRETRKNSTKNCEFWKTKLHKNSRKTPEIVQRKTRNPSKNHLKCHKIDLSQGPREHHRPTPVSATHMVGQIITESKLPSH